MKTGTNVASDGYSFSRLSFLEFDLDEWRAYRNPRVVPYLTSGHREKLKLDKMALRFRACDEAGLRSSLLAAADAAAPSGRLVRERHYLPGPGEFALYEFNRYFPPLGVILRSRPRTSDKFVASIQINAPFGYNTDYPLWEHAAWVLREVVAPYADLSTAVVHEVDSCFDLEVPITEILVAPVEEPRRSSILRIPEDCPMPTVYIGKRTPSLLRLYEKGKEQWYRRAVFPHEWSARIETSQRAEVPLQEFGRWPTPLADFRFFNARTGLRTDPFVSLAQGGMNAILSEHPRDWWSLMSERLTPADRIGPYGTPDALAQAQWKMLTRAFLRHLGL